MARGVYKGFYKSIEEQSKDLDAAVVKHLAALHGPAVTAALLKDGETLKRKIQGNAPESTRKNMSGQARKYRGVKPGYGKLKDAVVAKAFKNQQPGSPAVFVALDRKIAFQGHLVEFGHKLVKRAAMSIRTGFMTATARVMRVVGKVAPKKFFRPAVKSFKGMPHTEAALKRIIERAGK